MTRKGIRALLFDLGGVLLDIDFGRAFASWASISRLSHGDLKEAFQRDLPYQRHERGEIGAPEYFTHVRETLQLEGDGERIVAGWNEILVAEIAQTRQMLEAVRGSIPCYVLTNSNPTHQAAFSARFPTLMASFERVFVSSDIGHRKPEREAFEFVANSIGMPLDAIMFFDDQIENVEGAAAAGLEAVHVRTPADIRTALLSIGYRL